MENAKKEPLRKRLLRFAALNAGTALMAVGIYFFKTPNGFATGGVSGVSILLARLGGPLTQAQYLIILNVLLLVLGVIVLGRECGISTVYCSLMFSLETRLLELLVPLSGPLTDQPLLELTYAILLGGIGSAIIFNCHSSSGGTDIVALILKKYTSMDVGKALLISDAAVAFSSFFIVGLRSGLFSVLGLFAKAFLIDGIIEQINMCKAFTIITTQPEQIERYVIDRLHRGVTVEKATGGYTGEDKAVLLCVCRRGDAVHLKRAVKRIDPNAFIIVTSSSEILGRGFGSV